MTTRRIFLASIPATALALGLAKSASARAEALSESDPAAMALGYKANAAKVDAKKFPAYVAGHQCNGCALYGGKAADPMAPCAAFGGKTVAAKGWCSAWSKKA